MCMNKSGQKIVSADSTGKGGSDFPGMADVIETEQQLSLHLHWESTSWVSKSYFWKDQKKGEKETNTFRKC